MHTDSGAHYIVVQICTHLHFRKGNCANFQLHYLEVVQPAALPQKLCKTHSKLCKCAKYCGKGSCGAVEVVVQMLVVQMWHSANVHSANVA